MGINYKKLKIMELRNVKHEFSREEKIEFISELYADELFDLIVSVIGRRNSPLLMSEVKDRILDEWPEHFVDTDKVSEVLEKLPNESECKTVIEALAVQELNKMIYGLL